MRTIIDSHIHLDKYPEEQLQRILQEAEQNHIASMIAVSMDLASCKYNFELAERHKRLVLPAFGFHPEQPFPSDSELSELFAWIRLHASSAVAIGEVGLPYYTGLEAKQSGSILDSAPYIELLRQWIELAKELDLPLILHAVYEDAEVACDLLEEASYTRAHFHWYKGDPKTTERIARDGCYISFTPDILYETEIQSIIETYPVSQVMAETDGPWPFEGPFQGESTHPAMLHASIPVFSKLTGLQEEEAYRQLLHNTNLFYRLNKL